MQTVRLRFTIMYVALFLFSGVSLLVLSAVLTISSTRQAVPAQQRPDAAAARIAELESQLASVHEDQARQQLQGSAVALSVMGVVSFVLGRAVAGRVLRPLRAITAATRRISADNLHERLAVPGPDDEVKALADTIDDLLERLEQAFEAQRRFVANASHELRTPLATMRATLDVAAAKPGPVPPQTLALAGRLRAELDRVDALLAGFLTLAHAQHGALGRARHGTAAGREPVSLTALAGEALSARAAGIDAGRLTVRTELPVDAWTSGNAVLLARMTDNLIDNAVVHNEPGGWIEVTAGPGALTVESGGPRLEPDRVARLGRPFQRLAADRTVAGGPGLGLSIVAAVVAAHAGTLTLHARPEGGLRVEVRLPPPAGQQDASLLPAAAGEEGGA
ncbi:signal transduction histidine kinase [Catenuloplanes nepalensis]|uniref:histidine kinase n=1 Tax=Catenuloplanes nepalensis TaxID=587533 RepID=A0ABT9MQV7_9ACTN|nr:HAMP domain-containing sensor histidine kinase [Catenuloplanes nepalensis]MDP9793812.1 signal transduction histidine kinase [Catenuloplanes nepalensis]